MQSAFLVCVLPKYDALKLDLKEQLTVIVFSFTEGTFQCFTVTRLSCKRLNVRDIVQEKTFCFLPELASLCCGLRTGMCVQERCLTALSTPRYGGTC